MWPREVLARGGLLDWVFKARVEKEREKRLEGMGEE